MASDSESALEELHSEFPTLDTTIIEDVFRAQFGDMKTTVHVLREYASQVESEFIQPMHAAAAAAAASTDSVLVPSVAANEQELNKELWGMSADQSGLLPIGWIEHIDSASGDTYYEHEATGQTQWERPTAVPGNPDRHCAESQLHEFRRQVQPYSNDDIGCIIPSGVLLRDAHLQLQDKTRTHPKLENPRNFPLPRSDTVILKERVFLEVCYCFCARFHLTHLLFRKIRESKIG